MKAMHKAAFRAAMREAREYERGGQYVSAATLRREARAHLLAYLAAH
jgi:hypothetical protein